MYKKVLHDILTSYIILHNMMVENERELFAPIQNLWDDPTSMVEIPR